MQWLCLRGVGPESGAGCAGGQDGWQRLRRPGHPAPLAGAPLSLLGRPPGRLSLEVLALFQQGRQQARPIPVQVLSVVSEAQ